MRPVLEQIREGMQVEDSTGQVVGTVDFLHFGDDDSTTAAVASPAASPAMESGRGLSVIDVFTDMLGKEDMPESLRQRLTRRGFMRLKSEQLAGADRYIMPSRIASVTGERVVLAVAKEALHHRG